MPVTNKRGLFRSILLGTLAIASGPLAADEVILKDGSRLLGEVVRQKEGVLEFKTAFAGVISVKWDQVSELLADEPFDVFLDGREVLQATAIRNDAEGATIEFAGAPSRQVPAARLVSINPEDWERGHGYKLSGIVNAGLEFQEGNTDQQKVALDSTVKVRRQHDRLNIAAQYQKDKSNDVTTAKNWFLHNKYDYFLTKKRYWGGSLNFEQDRYADLELRTTLGPHIGYQFFESRQMNLGADIALMYVMDEYYVAPDEEYAALGWNIDFDKMLLSERIQFYHKQNGLFELGNDGNVVVHTWTGFRFPLVAGILASMEAQLDYDDGAPSGIDKVDTIYRAKLGYQW
jgi:putative salt-induced outer membrane protein YdiY